MQKRNEGLGSLACFTEAIRGQKFSRQALHRWFNKLVGKDDYEKKEKKKLMKQLESI